MHTVTEQTILLLMCPRTERPKFKFGNKFQIPQAEVTVRLTDKFPVQSVIKILEVNCQDPICRLSSHRSQTTLTTRTGSLKISARDFKKP